MTEKKSICFVLPAFFPETKGGSEFQAYVIARELLKHGWEVHYIREKGRRVRPAETVEGIELHSLPRRNTRLKWLNLPPLFRMMKKIRAQFWYCRATVSYIFPVWLAARASGGRVVWACSSRVQVSDESRRGYRKESFLLRAFQDLDRLLFRSVIRKIDLIILQSHEQKMWLERKWGLSGPVIYNSHPPVSFPEGPREPLVLWVGRLQPWKHPEYFVHIVRRLHGKPYRFLAMGREIEKIGITGKFKKTERFTPKFKYLGEIDREEVCSLLERARLLVNTSDFEGFSNTFIEAWLRGVPVVSLTEDPDGLIRDRGLGMVSGSLDRLAGDIENLMDHPEAWRETSARCRKFAEEHFNSEVNVRRLEEELLKLQE
jgi:glycosyltransferase involved in cell wall biosynthesis